MGVVERRIDVIQRAVPDHDLDVLSDCSAEDLITIEETIADAIAIGAPLYNEGDHEGCFRIYESTALDLDRKLATCTKVRSALLDGVKRAATADGFTFKAWAMRDAFDGVLHVIAKKMIEDGAVVPAFVPERRVPKHDVGLLRGSTPESIARLENAIGDAIHAGAPLYNEGNAEACFRIYQGTVLNLLRTMLAPGPKSALEAGLERSDAAKGWEAKAWAMRDTFDGILDVVARKLATELN
jgi:hypothetical protein